VDTKTPRTSSFTDFVIRGRRCERKCINFFKNFNGTVSKSHASSCSEFEMTSEKTGTTFCERLARIPEELDKEQL
jgi:hypothetical protein